MSLRTSLKNLLSRSPAGSLRERSAELRGSLPGQTRRAVVAGTAAAAVPLPALATPAATQSGLARACDAATAHLAWVNDTAQRFEPWADERLHHELDKVDDVLWRVADEPASGLDDLSAKARLILANDGQHLSMSRLADDRATLTLLREVVALSPARSLPRAPEPLPIERADYRARLLAAYEEDRLSRPISGKAEGGSIEERAACIVQMRCWTLAREILALPPPATVDGLALTALAATVLVEADFTNNDPTVTAAVGMTRATLGFTSTSHLFGFVGFGDEPDLRAKEDAVYAEAGSLPAWAIAQAEVERAGRIDDDEDEANA